MKITLGQVRCCYCGQLFTPTVEPPADWREDEVRDVAQRMQSMIDIRTPVECGSCRDNELEGDGIIHMSDWPPEN